METGTRGTHGLLGRHCRTYSWTIVSLASHPNTKLLGKFAFQALKFWKDLSQILTFDSSVSCPSSDVLDFFFLLWSFEVLITKKKKQTSLRFDNSKSHSSCFLQIPFQACWISSSLSLQAHFSMPQQNTFSQIAAIMWHSALSVISLLIWNAIFQSFVALLYTSILKGIQQVWIMCHWLV